MDIMVVGDVHGCYHTFKTLVEKNWKPGAGPLIQLGDLINKGANSARCIKYWQELEQNYPQRVFLIRGNHEQNLINNHIEKNKTPAYKKLKDDCKKAGLKIGEVVDWLRQKPLSWEGKSVLVTHAGISEAAADPFNIEDENGVLENRKALKNLAKVQVIGHTVLKGNKPLYSTEENAWRIDTGAWTKKYLSALKMNSENNRMVEVIQQLTSPLDQE